MISETDIQIKRREEEEEERITTIMVNELLRLRNLPKEARLTFIQQATTISAHRSGNLFRTPKCKTCCKALLAIKINGQTDPRCGCYWYSDHPTIILSVLSPDLFSGSGPNYKMFICPKCGEYSVSLHFSSGCAY